MCFEFDASPPDLPPGRALRGIAGGAAAESLVLTSSDGNRFAAALAESPEPRGSAVVVLPDVRGLYRFYVELVERLAEAGHHAIALDYFGRTAGAEERGEDFDFSPEVSADPDRDGPARPRGGALRPRRANRSELGRQPRLLLRRDPLVLRRDQPRARPRRGDRLLRAVGSGPGRENQPAEHARARSRDLVPVLGLFGGADQAIPVEDVEAFDASSTPPASSTRSSPIPARRTPSSTNRPPSTPRRRGMPGTGSSTSSANRPPELRSRSARTPCRIPQSDLGGHR